MRSAFVVTAQGTGVSKGVGYVAFAIREDAQAAFTKIAQEGLQLDGRSLRVQWANKKVRPSSSYPGASLRARERRAVRDGRHVRLQYRGLEAAAHPARLRRLRGVPRARCTSAWLEGAAPDQTGGLRTVYTL